MTKERDSALPLLSSQDFHASGWDSVLQQDPNADYTSMFYLLHKAAEVSADNGEQSSARVLRMLAKAMSMMLAPDNLTMPFRPLAESIDGRSAIPEDFTRQEVDLFAEVAAGIPHRLLRARLADLIWHLNKKKGVNFAIIAIDAYRESPPCPATWLMKDQIYWQRAIQLGLSIRQAGSAAVAEIEASLLQAFRATASTEGFPTKSFVDLLLTYGLASKHADEIANRLQTIGQEHYNAKNYHGARAYFVATREWFGVAKNQEKYIDMQIKVADTFEQEAIARESQMVAMDLYDDALQILRTIPKKSRALYKIDDKLIELARKIAEAGRDALTEMPTIRGPGMNIDDIVTETYRSMQGLSALQALNVFANLYHGPNVAQSREQVKEFMRNSITHMLFATSVISNDGRTVARRSASRDDDSAQDGAILMQMIRHFGIAMEFVTKAQILPALEVMNMEHALNEFDFINLCVQSAFVPPDRIRLIAKGLYAGYCGDFVQAIHILAPQLEHAVRYHLKRANAETTTTSKEGVVMENGLSSLVSLPEMNIMFGADRTFEITAIFCDATGPNLRNQVAHGLLTYDESHSIQTVYAWWMLLRMVVNTFWTPERAQEFANKQTKEE